MLPTQAGPGGVSHVKPMHGSTHAAPMQMSLVAVQSVVTGVYVHCGTPPGELHVPVAGYVLSVLPVHPFAGGVSHVKPTHGSTHAPFEQILSCVVQSSVVGA